MNLKKQLISMNYSKGQIIKPEFIVIHETANKARGANAQSHFRFWDTNPNAKSSAHFVVDDQVVIQLAEFKPGSCWRCWHVGDNKGHSNITNSNSIGIEICVNSDGDFEKARQNCIELVKWLMPQVWLGSERVVRHYDSSGKHCPATMLDHPEMWDDFKRQIKNTGTSEPVRKEDAKVDALKVGTKSDAVKTLQVKLTKLGYALVADGDFGPKTEAAVKDFQSKIGLTVDGVVGPVTQKALDTKIAKQGEHWGWAPIRALEATGKLQKDVHKPTDTVTWAELAAVICKVFGINF